MSSKRYVDDIYEGVNAENTRTGEDVTVVKQLDDNYDIWVVEGAEGNLYLERESNLTNLYYWS